MRAGNAPVLRARGIAFLGLKFVVCYAALLGLVYLLIPVIYPVFARAARDLLVLGTGVPRISGLSMHEARPLFEVIFRIETPLHGGPLFLREPALAFTLLFPLALILALPRRLASQRWQRFAWVALAALLYGAFVLAYVADNYLTTVVARSQIRVQPEWRNQIYAWTHTWSWSLSTIIFPLTASLYALAPILLPKTRPPTPEPSDAVPGKAERKQERRRHRLEAAAAALRDRGRGRRQLLAFALILLVAATLDGLAQYRVSTRSPAALAASLEPLNADVGRLFLEVAEREVELGRPSRAREGFSAALRYPAQRRAAEQGLRQLEQPLDPASKAGSRGGGA